MLIEVEFPDMDAQVLHVYGQVYCASFSIRWNALNTPGKKGEVLILKVSVLFCSDSVTHIAAENNSGSEVLKWLQVQNIRASSELELLDVSWLIESMGAGKPVEITGKHQLVVSVLKVVVCGLQTQQT